MSQKFWKYLKGNKGEKIDLLFDHSKSLNKLKPKSLGTVNPHQLFDISVLSRVPLHTKLLQCLSSPKITNLSHEVLHTYSLISIRRPGRLFYNFSNIGIVGYV